jgi:hypothetical protein
MGREIRRVPADWRHPMEVRNGREGYRPLFDQDYQSAALEWIANFDAWRSGTHENCAKHAKDYPFYWEWNGGPPDKESYRDRAWTEEEATHFQIYETVSEGTPVSPVFATKEEMIEYLVQHGDFWDKQRGNGGWSREAATAFVNAGSACSMMVNNGVISEPRDAAMYRT